MWGYPFDASIADRQASKGPGGGCEFTQTLPCSRTSLQVHPSAPNCLSLRNPDPVVSGGRTPAGTHLSCCHKTWCTRIFFFFFHFGSCSGWRLKHRVSKPKQKPPSPPRHGRCLGKGLILQKFDPNLCEDSGDCKNPGAYMGFLKLVISWEELQPLPGNITRSSTGMFKALRKKLWLFSLLNAWGCTDPGVCLSQWSTRCHPPLGPAENPCLIVTVHLKLLKPGGFFLLLEFQESLCTALWFSRWVSRSPTPHQLQTAKFSKHYENTKKG